MSISWHMQILNVVIQNYSALKTQKKWHLYIYIYIIYVYVCVCMCVYVYGICIFSIYIHIHIHINIHTYIHTYTYIHLTVPKGLTHPSLPVKNTVNNNGEINHIFWVTKQEQVKAVILLGFIPDTKTII